MASNISERRFIGKICPKHLEEGGVRLRSNQVCVACNRERGKRWRTKQRAKRRAGADKRAA